MNLVELNRHGSELVNITAWLTMAISLGWFVMSIVYVGIYVLWVPQEDLRAIVTTLVDDGILLLSIPWFLDHLVQYLVSAVITASLLFFSSLERLRRKEWARVFFIVAVGASVVANIAPLVALAWYAENVFAPLALAEDPLLALRWLMGILIVALSGLLILMMRQLNSLPIREEFRSVEQVELSGWYAVRFGSAKLARGLLWHRFVKWTWRATHSTSGRLIVIGLWPPEQYSQVHPSGSRACLSAS
jgi:hypothetical protein